MFLLLIIAFLVVPAIFENEDPQFSYLPLPWEGGILCSNRVLSAGHLIGMRPSKENYFDGTFDFERFEPLSQARVELCLGAPANLTLDSKHGRVEKKGNTFYIEFFRQDDGKYQANFKVQGLPNGAFPAIDAVYLNGEDICPEKTDWRPTILGSHETAAVNLDVPTDEDFVEVSTCGVRKVQRQALITNGFPSEEGDWPWHAALFHVDRRSSQYKCGGSLISSTAVLTAGHCVSENFRIMTPDRVLVKLGQHNRLIASRNTQEHTILKVTAHEEFDPVNLHNDIAILRLATEATFTDYVQPVCLWDQTLVNLNEVIGKRGYVVGWGFNENDALSDILSQASMPVVSLTTCLNSNRPFFSDYITDMNFCAGFRNGTTVCNGDSGGGMVFETDGVFKLRGVVSLSVPRDKSDICSTDHFVLFTDVAKYLDWIDTELKK